MSAVSSASRVKSKAEVELHTRQRALGIEAAEAELDIEPGAAVPDVADDDAEQHADAVSAQSARRYQELAAQLRGQAQLAVADAAAGIAQARAKLAEAEQHASAVAMAVRDLEPIAVDLETRIRHAAIGLRARTDAAAARTRLQELEAEHAEQSARAAVLADKLKPLRIDFGEVRAAVTAARSSGDIDALQQARSREAALAEVVGDLEQEHRGLLAKMQERVGALEAARAQCESLDRRLVDYRLVAGAEHVTDAWTPMLGLLRCMREGLFADTRREELDAVLRSPDLSGIYGHAQRTLDERIAAGGPLDAELPNAVLRGFGRIQGNPARRVEEGAEEVYARSSDWRDTAQYVFRRTGQLEKVESGLVLQVYQFVGEAR